MNRLLSRALPTVAMPSEDEQRGARARERWRKLIEAVGGRYESCRLANFAKHSGKSSAQDSAVASLRALSENVREHVMAGGNLIICGPPGTGKDHLLIAVLRAAILSDVSVDWINGQDLYGTLRDRIDTDTSEDRSVRQFCRAAVLAISDPVPPKGETSNYSATMLYRIVDRRYRELRSTWITANVLGAKEAAKELTGPIFDRLADNCVTIECNWPSYRQSRKPSWMEAR